MRYGLEQLVDSPQPDPVLTVAQAKAHLRVDFSDDDALIETLIQAATVDAESFCSAAFVPRRYRMTLGAFPGFGPGQFGTDENSEFPAGFGAVGRPQRHPTAIYLPVHPVTEVVSVKYLDANGDEQTLASESYVAVTSRRPAFIVPAAGTCWPSVYDHPEAVRVEFRAGYEPTPAPVLIAIKLRLASLYEHREDIVVGSITASLPRAAEHWLGAYRMWPLP